MAVLQPRFSMADSTLLYIAALLNWAKWRYSFGRKCFRNKLNDVLIPLPATKNKVNINNIDEDALSNRFPIDLKSSLPTKDKHHSLSAPILQWKAFSIGRLFTVKRGDFHSLAALATGNYRTVSRISTDNGTVGYFEIPDKAKVYTQGKITVSTVGGDAFVQLDDFIATDNVLILIPKQPVAVETLFFVTFALNRQRWRYSYGRQCYKTKFELTTNIWLPVNKEGELDENSIKNLLHNTIYWDIVSKIFRSSKSQRLLRQLNDF